MHITHLLQATITLGLLDGIQISYPIRRHGGTSSRPPRRRENLVSYILFFSHSDWLFPVVDQLPIHEQLPKKFPTRPSKTPMQAKHLRCYQPPMGQGTLRQRMEMANVVCIITTHIVQTYQASAF
jgi:hypothetical protein